MVSIALEILGSACSAAVGWIAWIWYKKRRIKENQAWALVVAAALAGVFLGNAPTIGEFELQLSKNLAIGIQAVPTLLGLVIGVVLGWWHEKNHAQPPTKT